MSTIFMNSQNSKASDLHRLFLNLSNEIDLKRNNNYVALLNLSIYYGKIKKKSHKNSKFKMYAPTWNDKSELPDGSYSASNIQYNSEYMIKKH